MHITLLIDWIRILSGAMRSYLLVTLSSKGNNHPMISAGDRELGESLVLSLLVGRIRRKCAIV